MCFQSTFPLGHSLGRIACQPQEREGRAYLEIVHSVGQRDDKTGVVGDRLVAEDDVHAVIEVPEVLLRRRELAVVVLWVVPANAKEQSPVDSNAPRLLKRCNGS